MVPLAGALRGRGGLGASVFVACYAKHFALILNKYEPVRLKIKVRFPGVCGKGQNRHSEG